MLTATEKADAIVDKILPYKAELKEPFCRMTDEQIREHFRTRYQAIEGKRLAEAGKTSATTSEAGSRKL
ncbi:MAG: hypothetical protein VB039_08825 [Oscillospiraceae bacterium]|nr:hypothetical protein [Oscillospiraceae bacterium]